MALRDIAEWLLDHQPNHFHRSLLASNFLTEETWLERVGDMLRLKAGWMEETSILWAGFEQAKLALATAVLEDFFFVGLVSEMDESIRQLNRKLESYGLRLRAGDVPMENISSELRDDVEWLTMSNPIGREILARLEVDAQLYRRFEARFQAMCRDCQSEDSSAV
jgi:hypothetical protein